MFDKTELGKTLAAVGVVAGIFYGMKKAPGVGSAALYAAIFGVSGVLIGNALTKFYE